MDAANRTKTVACFRARPTTQNWRTRALGQSLLPLSLSLFSAIKGIRGRGTPEGVSTHALKKQTFVVGIEVVGREAGVFEASFQLPVKLF